MISRLTRHRLASSAVLAGTIGLAVAGCGSSGGGSASSSTPTTTASKPSKPSKATGTQPASCGSSTASAGASEAQSTASGDIPDNQQFLSYKNPAAGYTISYPEGWARSGSGSAVTFLEKGNTITIKTKPGSQPTPASVSAELKQQASADPCLKPGTPQATTAGPNKVVKVTYTTQGKQDPVTGQRPKITVDRYVYFAKGKVATIDLATPVGVDNVDAYRMISESFRWG